MAPRLFSWLPLAATVAFTLTVVVPASAQQSAGQETLQVEEHVVVTATRLEHSVEDVGSSVTVVSADEIRASGAIWLMDVLARVPGISVARTGGPGSVTTAFVRGTNSNHTLVLINGVKANSPATGSYDLAALPASSIERVEIIRGPQSALYGSEAIGGVINIITRSGGGSPEVEAAVEAGAYGTVHTTAAAQGVAGKLQFGFGFDHFDSDNFSAADENAGNRERDRYRSTAFDARLGYEVGSGLGLDAFVSYFDGSARFDGYDFTAGPIDDPNALQSNRELYAGLSLALDRGLYTGRLTLSSSDQDLGTQDPDGFQPQFELQGTVHEIDFQSDFRIDTNNTTTIGVEHRRESAVSHSTSVFGISGYDERINVTGAYAQHRVSVRGRAHLTAGLRTEHHSRFGTTTTFRITGAYTHPSGLRFHGSLGTGFRAPTFNELFFPGFGNPELAPEQSTGWDVGIGGRWLQGRLTLDATWFHSDLEQLIEFTFPLGFVNLGEATARGLETTGSFAFHRAARLDLAYTFTDARPVGSDFQLLRRPRHQGSIALRVAPSPRWSLFTDLRFKSARNDFGTAGPLELPAFAVWNAAAQLRITESLQAVGRVDNLTDTRYQEVWGYGTPGISGYLGLRYRWSSRPR